MANAEALRWGVTAGACARGPQGSLGFTCSGCHQKPLVGPENPLFRFPGNSDMQPAPRVSRQEGLGRAAHSSCLSLPCMSRSPRQPRLWIELEGIWSIFLIIFFVPPPAFASLSGKTLKIGGGS